MRAMVGFSMRVSAAVEGAYRLVIGFDVLGGGSLVLELGDVGPGHECPVAGPRQQHNPHRVVFGEAVERFRRLQPHLQRHGVVPGRVVEGQPGDAVGDVDQDAALLGGGDFLGGHGALLMGRSGLRPHTAAV